MVPRLGGERQSGVDEHEVPSEDDRKSGSHYYQIGSGSWTSNRQEIRTEEETLSPYIARTYRKTLSAPKDIFLFFAYLLLIIFVIFFVWDRLLLFKSCSVPNAFNDSWIVDEISFISNLLKHPLKSERFAS